MWKVVPRHSRLELPYCGVVFRANAASGMAGALSNRAWQGFRLCLVQDRRLVLLHTV